MYPYSRICLNLAASLVTVSFAILLALFRSASPPVVIERTFQAAGGTPLAGLPLPVEIGPHDLDTFGLPEYLAARNLRLHVVSLYKNGGDLEGGYYLCERPRAWESLFHARLVEFQDQWVGVVSVQRRSSGHLISQMQEWGAHCLLTRHSVLFGDPQLLARIRKALDRPVETLEDHRLDRTDANAIEAPAECPKAPAGNGRRP